MGQSDDLEFVELLRQLGVYQAQINAELAKGAKADRAKIARAYAAGKDFARDAAPYCHSTQTRSAGAADGGMSFRSAKGRGKEKSQGKTMR